MSNSIGPRPHASRSTNSDPPQRRTERLPRLAQDQYNSQVRDLLGKFQATLEEDVGGTKGLTKLTLSVQLSKSTVKVSRFFRPEARLKPVATAPPSSQQLGQ